jgi:hypothetical protein
MTYQIILTEETYTNNILEITRDLYFNTTITSLYIDRCNIGNDGAIAISNLLLHNTTITELSITNDNVKIEGIVALGKMIGENNTLTHLNLSSVTLDAPMQPIINGVALNQSINTLNLSNNFIYTLNFIAISNILRTNNILKKLNLSATVSYEGLDGIRFILAVLSNYNRTLIELDLSDNCLDDDIASNELLDLLQSTNLQVVNLEYNNISQDMIDTISNILQSNSTIKHITF